MAAPAPSVAPANQDGFPDDWITPAQGTGSGRVLTDAEFGLSAPGAPTSLKPSVSPSNQGDGYPDDWFVPNQTPALGSSRLMSDAEVGIVPPPSPHEMTDEQFLGVPASASQTRPIDSGPNDWIAPGQQSNRTYSDAEVGIYPPPAPPSSTWTDVAKSAGQGLISGSEGLIGMLGDVRHAADYGALWAEAKAAESLGQLPKGETAASVIAKYHGSAGRAFLSNLGVPDNTINALGAGAPTSEAVAAFGRQAGVPDYQPQTTPGKYALSVGSFLPGAVLTPETSIPKVAANVAKYAIAPGAASEAAGELYQGTPYEGTARNVAAIATGGLADLGQAGFNSAAHFAEPFSAAGQQALAAQKLRGQFTNPDAASAELAKAAALQTPGAGLGEIVPGSKPTTGQLTGDMGAMNFEREIATRDPAMYQHNDFGTGAAQQNAARVDALGAVQSTGPPEAVGEAVRGQLASIEAAHTATIADATQQARQAASGIGVGAPPEEVGERLRSALQGARDDAKAQERDLWNAVDPDGTLTMPATSIADAAKGISGAMPSTAKPMEGEESAIFGVASGLPSLAPLRDITALRSRASDAMREELQTAGQTPSYARLSQLRGSLEQAIISAAEHDRASDAASAGASELPQGTFSGVRAGDVPDTVPAGGASVRLDGAGGPGQGDPGPGPSAGSQGISGPVSQVRGQVLGPGRVYHPTGALDVNYELAEAPDLVTSHDTNFRVNQEYPADLQPRERASAPARDQVNMMAARLQPERLGPSPEANSGAPIVGPDNVVESGNGRTLAIMKAYQNGRGGAYRDWLDANGVDTSGYTAPMLVGRRVTPLAASERVTFAHATNTASGLAMSDGEKAFSDAKLITPSSLSEMDAGPVASAANRPFVRSLLEQLSTNERADFLDRQGSLSQKGIRRVELAMLAKGFGDPDFIDRAFVSPDLHVRSLAGALVDAAPAWTKMREAARLGVIDGNHDVTPSLMTAVRGVLRAKGEGRPVSETLGNGDLFGEDSSNQARNLILDKSGRLGTRDAISGNLRKYAEEAQKNLAAPNLFGDSVAPGEVLRAALKASAEPTPVVESGLESAALRPPLRPTMDTLAAARLKAATEATKRRAVTFDRGTVGSVLRKGASAAEYKAADSSVPSKIFPKGAGGAEAIRAYHAASSKIAPLLDAAAESLRRDAMTPQGILSPEKFSRWQAQHQDALRALPPGLSSRFSNAAKASEAIGDAAAARKSEVDGFQKSEAGRLSKLEANHDIVSHVGFIMNAGDGVRRMSQLARSVGNNPDAVEGLRKAVLEHILGRATSVMEGGASSVNKLKLSDLVDMVHKNSDVIRAAGFSPREIGSLQAVAMDLQRSQRTLQATRLPGGSNSPQDILKSISSGEHGPKLSLLGKIGAGALLGMEHGPHGAILGAIGGIGEHLVAGMRAAGVAKTNALIRDAMLSPELAASLLAKPFRANAPAEHVVARLLARSSMYPSAQAGQRSSDRQRVQ